jgi:PBSX family phage terminase large subunit
MKCPVCQAGAMKRVEGRQYSLCDLCNASYIHYKPLPHQLEFHKDNHTFKAIFGAYGSGKTTTAVNELIGHMLAVPNGRSAMLAPTMQMLRETSYKELMDYLPHTFIEDEIKSKGSEKLILKNGHELLLLPSDSADKIRSLNLTAFYLEEASNSKFEIYSELTARTRNKVAIQFNEDGTQKKNKLLGIICSNPDSGWIRTEILHKADKVFSNRFYPRDPNYNPFMSAHLHSSYQNKYLDKDFQARIGRGKPDWWVQRYLYGSFDYAEGLVYPMGVEHIIDPFLIPPNWKRIFGVDFGLRDATVMLGAAIDPVEGIVHIYDEHYENEKPVHHHAKKMLAIMQKVPHGMIRGMPVADPKGQNRGSDFRSYFGHYQEYGIFFKPGNNKLESGLMKVFTYFSLGKLKIHSNCVNVIRELREYKYRPTELDQDKNRGEKPVDANNHSMDAMRYIIQELPDDPDKVVNEVYFTEGEKFSVSRQDHLPWELRDNVEVEQDWYQDYGGEL